MYLHELQEQAEKRTYGKKTTTAKQLMTILKFNWKRYEKANVRKNSTKK